MLRYAALYGPGASDEVVTMIRKRQFPIIGPGTGVMTWVHADDAAEATVLAIEQRTSGLFNIADDEPSPVNDCLRYLAETLGAKPPMRLPTWVGRLVAGPVAVSMMTRARGSSNAKAKKELGWEPRWPTWREGFRDGLGG